MNTSNTTTEQSLIDMLVAQFAALPQVAAIALGGSRCSGAADAASDIDIYIYTRGAIALAERQAIQAATGGASVANMGMTFWGDGDEWIDAASGVGIDLIYFDAAWMKDQLGRVLDQHLPQGGYTTCFWRTVREGQIVFDRDGWLPRLQQHSQQAYPEPLRRAIIAHNYPVLRHTISSYRNQIARAIARQDFVSLNHRVAALCASYFDIIFALNRVLHPGEKRLLALAQRECALLPTGFAVNLAAVLHAAGTEPEQLVGAVDVLLDQLDALLAQEGMV